MRVGKHVDQEFDKLIRLLSFIVYTRDGMLCLEVDESSALTWCVDAAFAACSDVRSYVGSIFALVKESIISGSDV